MTRRVLHTPRNVQDGREGAELWVYSAFEGFPFHFPESPVHMGSVAKARDARDFFRDSAAHGEAASRFAQLQCSQFVLERPSEDCAGAQFKRAFRAMRGFSQFFDSWARLEVCGCIRERPRQERVVERKRIRGAP